MTGRALVIGDDAVLCEPLARILENAYFQATWSEGDGWVRAIRHLRPDVVVLADQKAGVDLCRELKSVPEFSRIPTVLRTETRQAGAFAAAISAGADDVFCGGTHADVFALRLRGLLRQKTIVDDLMLRSEFAVAADEGIRGHLAAFDWPCRVTVLSDDRALFGAATSRDDIPGADVRFAVPSELGALAESGEPNDVLVVDSGPDILGTISQARASDRFRNSAIIIVRGAAGDNAAQPAIEVGASDMVIRTELHRALLPRIHIHCRMKAQVAALRDGICNELRHAMLDPLTGVYNRRYLERHLTRLLAQARGDQNVFCVAMLDLDFFKAVNDRYGHGTGDRALQAVAQRIEGCIRASDTLSRVGGEEFALLMPDTRLASARRTAERIRSVMENGGVPVGRGRVLDLTVSIGVAEIEPGMLDIGDVLNRADLALYQAKRNGRNNVQLADAAA